MFYTNTRSPVKCPFGRGALVLIRWEMGYFRTTTGIVVAVVIGALAGTMELSDGSAIAGWVLIGLTAGFVARRVVMPRLDKRNGRL